MSLFIPDPRNLFDAADAGNDAEVLRLLKDGAEIDQMDRTGWSPLHHAVLKGHISTVKVLVENGATVDQRCPGGAPPFIYAANLGHIGIARYLLSNGADLNVTSDLGKSALHWAMHNKQAGMAKVLMGLGLSPYAQDARGRNGFDFMKEAPEDMVADLRDFAAQLEMPDRELKRDITVRKPLRLNTAKPGGF